MRRRCDRAGDWLVVCCGGVLGASGSALSLFRLARRKLAAWCFSHFQLSFRKALCASRRSGRGRRGAPGEAFVTSMFQFAAPRYRRRARSKSVAMSPSDAVPAKSPSYSDRSNACWSTAALHPPDTAPCPIPWKLWLACLMDTGVGPGGLVVVTSSKSSLEGSTAEGGNKSCLRIPAGMRRSSLSGSCDKRSTGNTHEPRNTILCWGLGLRYTSSSARKSQCNTCSWI